jgi:phenylalanyl-tRNA synthetase alpha chain
MNPINFFNYLGKKGELTKILRDMRRLSVEDRPIVGQIANDVKNQINQLLCEKAQLLSASEEGRRFADEVIDVTLPGRPVHIGKKRLITRTMDERKEIIIGMGCSVDYCPDIESDYYCFEALNIPKNHPASHMQDSNLIFPDIVFRTHTSVMRILSYLICIREIRCQKQKEPCIFPDI